MHLGAPACAGVCVFLHVFLCLCARGCHCTGGSVPLGACACVLMFVCVCECVCFCVVGVVVRLYVFVFV